VQFVGQFVCHLWGEAQPFASGRELQGMAFADEGDLVPDLITDGDLVGSVAMDVRTHCLPPSLCLALAGTHLPGEVRNTLLTLQIQRPRRRLRAELDEDELTN
jgi:hypothetical protein